MNSSNCLSPEKRHHASRFIIWLTGFFGFLNVYSVQSILPLIIETFDATPVQAGITVGATIFAIALLSPFIGMLSDAFGRKSVLCISIFALTVPTALIPIAQSLHAVIFLRFLQGLCVPGIIVIILAYIAEEFDKDMVPRISSIYMGGSVIGGFSGRFVTGHLASLVGWKNAFFILAASIFVGALLMLLFLPTSQNFKPNRNVADTLKTLAGHMRNKRLLAACAVGFCVLFSLVGIFTYINLVLVKPPFNLSIAALANIFCVYLVGGELGRLEPHMPGRGVRPGEVREEEHLVIVTLLLEAGPAHLYEEPQKKRDYRDQQQPVAQNLLSDEHRPRAFRYHVADPPQKTPAGLDARLVRRGLGPGLQQARYGSRRPASVGLGKAKVLAHTGRDPLAVGRKRVGGRKRAVPQQLAQGERDDENPAPRLAPPVLQQVSQPVWILQKRDAV